VHDGFVCVGLELVVQFDSSSISGFMLPPELASKVDDLMKADLLYWRSLWFGWLLRATEIVIVGLVFEGPELAYEMLSIARNRIQLLRYRIILREDRLEFAKAVAFLGWILIVVGVAGEVVTEIVISDADANLQTFNDILIRDANKEAGTAKASAEVAFAASTSARNKADEIAKEADELMARMEGASRQLGQLKQDIVAQGPRWRRIAEAAPKLTKQLLAFTGQRVELFVCGRLGSQDGETLSTWGAIANIVEDNGAKWKVEHGGLTFFDRGCSPSRAQPLGQGIEFFVSKRASKSTMDAAKALAEGIIKVLPPSPSNALGIIDPDFLKFTQPIEGSDTPWAIAGNDPDLITVLIGAHPQQ
jgi:hypothetical protein